MWLICIAVLSLMHMPPHIEHHWWGHIPHLDKYVHITMYAILAACLYTGYTPKVLYVIVVSAGYGLLMEYFQQWFTTWRSFEWLDFAADSVGAILGYIAIRYITQNLQNRGKVSA